MGLPRLSHPSVNSFALAPSPTYVDDLDIWMAAAEIPRRVLRCLACRLSANLASR